jgi:hypothetical protein
MKFFALLVFLLPLALVGQSTTDYENAMAKFKKFYNAGQGDSLYVLFGRKWNKSWTNDIVAESLKKYGKLKSFKFIGTDDEEPNKVYVFKSTFSKVGIKAISLKMEKDNDISMFRFVTSSDGINELLSKSQKRR